MAVYSVGRHSIVLVKKRGGLAVRLFEKPFGQTLK